MTTASSPRGRSWAISAALVGFAMMAAYLALILSEGDDSLRDVLPWAGLIAVAASLALIAAIVGNVRLLANFSSLQLSSISG